MEIWGVESGEGSDWRFKIDLIVWKSRVLFLIRAWALRFKIDLIVWKLYSRVQTMV